MGLLERRRKRRKFAVIRLGIGIFAVVVFMVGLLWFFLEGDVQKESGSDEDRADAVSIESELMTETKLATETELMPEKESVADSETDIEVSAIQKEYQRILALPAGKLAASGCISGELMESLFYSTEIDDALFDKINGVSYTENEYVTLSDLRYLKMLCYGNDGNTYVGEMIVNEKIADTVLEIFQTLYENKYPIERMVLIDDYMAEDEASMSANNTSAFNFRMIAGSSKLSRHSYGMAVDINPMYNPCVKTAADGDLICQPANGMDYIDRSKDFSYKIDENDLAYQLFTEAGFTWGGSWKSLKDYQHFEMPACQCLTEDLCYLRTGIMRICVMR